MAAQNADVHRAECANVLSILHGLLARAIHNRPCIVRVSVQSAIII